MSGRDPRAERPAARRGFRPLPARSVLLSVLLGSHPPALPVRVLVRTAELFGIAEGTARVALSRLTADGEVVSDAATYGLSDRHLARQRGQDAALRPPTRPWDGRWELLSGEGAGETPAALDATAPPGAPAPSAAATSVTAGDAASVTAGDAASVTAGDAASVTAVASNRRMARLRPGLWARPDNLSVAAPPLPVGATLWVATVAAGSVPAASQLWDLDGWAAEAEALIADLTRATAPADRLALAAAIVRHIRADPLLPAELLAPSWPGAELRQVYDDYRAELGRLIGALRDA